MLHKISTTINKIRNITTVVQKLLPKYAKRDAQPLTVFVEGNLGSGKTTLLNCFEKNKNFCLLTEPVERWRHCGDTNLLELMYKDPNRWATPFQIYVILTMLELHIHQTNRKIKLMERSLYSTRYCFVEYLYKNKKIDKGMYSVLLEWYDFISKTIHIQADLIIYLRSDPEMMYERIKKRARKEESYATLDYLKQVHVLYEDWLIHKKHEETKNIPVFILDANNDSETIYRKSENYIMEVLHFDKNNVKNVQ